MNNYYKIQYRLYTVKNGESTLQEETTAENPFTFVSGFGATIPQFEAEIEKLAKGDSFDFTLKAEDAYGPHVDERVIKLPMPDDPSQFDLSEGAMVPLQNEDGTRFMAHVVGKEQMEGQTMVVLDLNHPLAGCDLNFKGTVEECREATNEEISQLINQLAGHGCGGCGGGCHSGDGGCGSCGDGGCGNCGDGGCGNCGDGGCCK